MRQSKKCYTWYSRPKELPASKEKKKSVVYLIHALNCLLHDIYKRIKASGRTLTETNRSLTEKIPHVP